MSSETSHPFVSRLCVYPVKGAQGIEVERIEFDTIGPRWDRRWVIVDEDGVFVSQRSWASLATVVTNLTDSTLILSNPSNDSVSIPLAGKGLTEEVVVWNSKVQAVFPSAEANEWLSTLGNRPLRLAFMELSSIREADPQFVPGGRVSFADGYPVLLITQSAVTKLADRVGRPIPTERFRANIVVENAAPHAEDLWRKIRIGSAVLDGVKLCARCKVTTLDQVTGGVDGEGEPLRSLATYRKIEKKVYFGVNMMGVPGTVVSVGDEVIVDELGAIPGAV